MRGGVCRERRLEMTKDGQWRDDFVAGPTLKRHHGNNRHRAGWRK
jgi:hypothetical protein